MVLNELDINSLKSVAITDYLYISKSFVWLIFQIPLVYKDAICIDGAVMFDAVIKNPAFLPIMSISIKVSIYL